MLTDQKISQDASWPARRSRRATAAPPGTYAARVLLPDGRPVVDGYFRLLRMGGGWRGLFQARASSLGQSPVTRWYHERQLRKVVLYVHGLGYASARIRQAALEANPRICELESLDGDAFGGDYACEPPQSIAGGGGRRDGQNARGTRFQR